MKNIIIIGASSGIGRNIAEHFASKGCNLIICSRNNRDLNAIANNLIIKYNITVKTKTCNIINTIELKSLIKFCINIGDFDAVFITVGQINNNDNGLLEFEDIDDLVKANYLSIIKLVSEFVKFFQKKKGHIVVFSSIATARARKNNILYGSAKTGLDFYCQGLQQLLSKTEIKIQIYRLGYIDTSMSFGKKLIFPVVSPEKIAHKLYKNLNKNIRIQYLPKFWKLICIILKLLPWFIFKKLTF